MMSFYTIRLIQKRGGAFPTITLGVFSLDIHRLSRGYCISATKPGLRIKDKIEWGRDESRPHSYHQHTTILTGFLLPFLRLTLRKLCLDFNSLGLNLFSLRECYLKNAIVKCCRYLVFLNRIWKSD